MPTRLTPEQLDRLVRSHRRLMISAVVAVVVVVAAAILLIPIGVPVPLGAGIGVLIGLLLLVPHRRVLNELGLSRPDATAILAADRERRTGVAALPPQVRAAREILRSRVYLAVGLVLIVAFCAAGAYFVNNAGKTVDEDAPSDPWFGISVFAGRATACLAPGFLWLARTHKTTADALLEKAAGDPSAVDH